MNKISHIDSLKQICSLLYIFFLFFIFILFHPSPSLSQVHRHKLPIRQKDTPFERPGYYLLMNETFEGPLDSSRWDRSGIGDENWECTKNYRHLEKQVYTQNGKLHIEIKPNPTEGCAYLGGEIKTFEYKEGSRFRNYWLFPGSYLEVRAKVPMGYGVASAGWLYSFGVNEVDMWEYWDEHEDRYQINYHWGEAYEKGKFDSDPYEVKLLDKVGSSIQMDEQFLTFGLEWDSTYIRHYLNGKLIKSYDLTQSKPRGADRSYLLKTPAFLRFNTAAAMRAPNIYLPDSLSKFLVLDYVRYYRKSGEWALPVFHVDDSIQKHPYGGGGSISVAYHPDASYRWFAPDFDVSDNSDPKCMCERVWLSFGPDLEANRSYPVFLSVEFPTGHREIRVWDVFVK